MYEILEQLNVAMEMVKEKTAKLDAELKASHELKDQLIAAKKVQEETAIDLMNREAAVSKIEDVVALEKQARDMMVDAEKQMKAAKDQIAAFNAYEEKTRAEIANLNLDIQRNVKNLEEREKKMQDLDAIVAERVAAIVDKIKK